MDWISVKDRLPENYVDVLIYDIKQGIFRASAIIEYGVAFWTESSTGYSCCSGNVDPTHWMPLPERPAYA
jgi:hypothetical protein